MPLHHGRTKAGIKTAIGKNIKLERSHGYSKKQSIAIALSTARKDASKAHLKPSSLGLRRRYKRR